MRFVDLGQVSFEAAERRQQETLDGIFRGSLPETVYLLEHPHVFTLGRRGDLGNILPPGGGEGEPVPVLRTNRGGDVTYHGPGQLVVYPQLNLARRGGKIGRYLRDLERCVIGAVRDFGVKAGGRPGFTGVWVSGRKLASLGVGVRKWITMHGLALNVNTDLSYFKRIHPCGLPECRMTSMAELLGGAVPMADVKEAFQARFLELFAPDRTFREPAEPERNGRQRSVPAE